MTTRKAREVRPRRSVARTKTTLRPGCSESLNFHDCVPRVSFAGRRVGANYWGTGATTLEWTVSSPPPFHQFERLPRIR